MNRVFNVYVLLLIGASLGLSTGCKKDPYSIVELEGVVTFDGQPVQNVTMIFKPQGDSGKTSTAMVTDPAGKFIAAYSVDRKGVKAGDIDVHVGVIDIPSRSYTANDSGKKAIEQYGYQTPPHVINIVKPDKDYQLELKPR